MAKTMNEREEEEGEGEGEKREMKSICVS